jgi:hypothetical protein
LETVTKPDAFKQVGRTIASATLAIPKFDERERDVCARRQRREQMKPVKNNPNMIESQPGPTTA